MFKAQKIRVVIDTRLSATSKNLGRDQILKVIAVLIKKQEGFEVQKNQIYINFQRRIVLPCEHIRAYIVSYIYYLPKPCVNLVCGKICFMRINST